MRKTILLAAALLTGAAVSGAANAASEAEELKDVEFSFEDWNGMYNKAAAQRGFQVYREICSACHALDYVPFRALTQIGYSDDQVKALASEYSYPTLDDYGDTVERPGRPTDTFPKPFPNEKAAAAANNGKAPPNLSLMAEAREGGADYIYSLLTGYVDVPPEDFDLPVGAYYNKYYPGHAIAMAPPLYDDFIVYADGTEATVEQMAKDVSHFLAWTAEPNMEQRKRLGMTTILYLILLTALFYATYRRIWAPVKKGATPWKDKLEEAEREERDGRS